MTWWTQCRTLSLALAIASAMPTIAFAQEAPAGTAPRLTEEQRAELGRLYDEAEAHELAGRHALAFQAFMRLHDELARLGSPRASVPLFGAGSALSAVPGCEREARDVLQRFLDESTTLVDDAEIADYRSRAAARITELEARIGSDDPAAAIPAGATGTSVSSDSPPPTAAVGSTSAAGESLSPVGPIVLGIGAAAVVAGLITGAVALGADGMFSDMCPSRTNCPEETRPSYDEARTLGTLSDALWIGGTVVAATGLLLTLFVREGGGEASPSVSAACNEHGCVGALAGQF